MSPRPEVRLPAEIEPYVLSLLVVALGDRTAPRKRYDLVHNATLAYALELVGELPGWCAGATEVPRELAPWTVGGIEVGDDLFRLCAALLDGLEERVRSEGRASGFDHSAQLALAQTLARTGGLRRARRVPVAEALERIARRAGHDLQRDLVTDYLGNVLQDYFDSCKLRATIRGLPDDEEQQLRDQDAADLADAVFETLGNGAKPLPVAAIQEVLQELMGLVWLEERRGDDGG